MLTQGGCGSSRLTLRFFKEETVEASLVLSGFVLLGNGLDSLMQFWWIFLLSSQMVKIEIKNWPFQCQQWTQKNKMILFYFGICLIMFIASQLRLINDWYQVRLFSWKENASYPWQKRFLRGFTGIFIIVKYLSLYVKYLSPRETKS